MKPKLLLINPWIYDFTAFDLWSKPLGLLYLAAFLREQGYDVSLIDCLQDSDKTGTLKRKKYGTGHYQKVEIECPPVLSHIPRRYSRYGISEEEFISELVKFTNCDAVLVTSIMTYWYPAVERVVKLVRKFIPRKPVLLGGIYASLMPEHAQNTICPDYLVSGPGEIKTLELLSRITGLPMNNRKLPKTLDGYPYPAFDLLKNPQYLIMMTARGCPYDCSFCAQKQIAMPYTRRNPQLVFEEFVNHYQKYKLRDFAFYDDALFISREKHIDIILDKLISKNLPLRLHSPNGLFAKYIDPVLADLMHRSQFKTIRLSFETSNETRRKDMYSKVSNEDMVSAVQNLVQAGYRASELESYVLMGLPGQVIDEVVASILFVHNLGVQVRLASFSPIPGTKEFETAVKNGSIPADIDPLLTNKSIFPLAQQDMTFETYRKLRTFSHILNEAARRDLKMFDNQPLGRSVKNVLRQIN